jgi:3D (Asp-Asp-Asp) domain-containing protein
MRVASISAVLAVLLLALTASAATAQTAAPTQPAPPAEDDGGDKSATGRWLTGVSITEYYAVPESWFIGRKVAAPGLPAKHRVDWLYSARGVSMEGDGIGLDGQRYHIENVGSEGWVNRLGKPTTSANGWAAGPPFWRRGGYWRARGGGITFPLDAGGWLRGAGKKVRAPRGISFASGPSRDLEPWRSVAVDPTVIPLGSQVYVPSHAKQGGGWMTAADVGGAVKGRHIDVYRPAPETPGAHGQSLTGQRIYVVPPGADRPDGAPTDA